MDPQLAAILTAIAAVLLAVAQCIREVRAYHHAVNSRMDELLALTKKSSLAEGRLEAASDRVGKSPTGLTGFARHTDPFQTK